VFPLLKDSKGQNSKGKEMFVESVKVTEVLLFKEKTLDRIKESCHLSQKKGKESDDLEKERRGAKG